jgi:hypothetical protein
MADKRIQVTLISNFSLSPYPFWGTDLESSFEEFAEGWSGANSRTARCATRQAAFTWRIAREGRGSKPERARFPTSPLVSIKVSQE